MPGDQSTIDRAVEVKLKTFKLAWESYELLERLGDRRFWNAFKSILVEEQEKAAEDKSNEGNQEPKASIAATATATTTTASNGGSGSADKKADTAPARPALVAAKQGDAPPTPKQGKNDSDGGDGSGGVTGAGGGSGKEDNDDDSAAKKKPPTPAAPGPVEESKGESDSEARGEGPRIKVEDLKKWSDLIAKKPSTDVFSFEIIRDVFSNQLNQNVKKMIAKWSEWYRVVRFRLFLAKPIFEFLSSYLQMTFI